MVVSPLTELESSVQLRGIYLGGSMGAARFEQTRERLAETLANHPFVKCPLARLGDRNQEGLVQGSGRRGRVCMDGLCRVHGRVCGGKSGCRYHDQRRRPYHRCNWAWTWLIIAELIGVKWPHRGERNAGTLPEFRPSFSHHHPHRPHRFRDRSDPRPLSRHSFPMGRQLGEHHPRRRGFRYLARAHSHRRRQQLTPPRRTRCEDQSHPANAFDATPFTPSPRIRNKRPACSSSTVL